MNITEESFSELGAENNDQFIPIFELGLADPDETPFHSGKLFNNTTPKGSVLQESRQGQGNHLKHYSRAP